MGTKLPSRGSLPVRRSLCRPQHCGMGAQRSLVRSLHRHGSRHVTVSKVLPHPWEHQPRPRGWQWNPYFTAEEAETVKREMMGPSPRDGTCGHRGLCLAPGAPLRSQGPAAQLRPHSWQARKSPHGWVFLPEAHCSLLEVTSPARAWAVCTSFPPQPSRAGPVTLRRHWPGAVRERQCSL